METIHKDVDTIIAEHIPAEQFERVLRSDESYDCISSSKPTGYFRDALNRFTKDKESVVCGFIILALILYALFAPVFSRYTISDKDGYYAFASPKSRFFAKFGFWDGSYKIDMNAQTYDYYSNIPDAVIKVYQKEDRLIAGRNRIWYTVRMNSYAQVGWVKMLLTKSEYEAARNWEKEKKVKLFYPIIDQGKVESPAYTDNQNAWFKTNQRGIAERDANGNVIPIYMTDEDSSDGLAYTVSRMNGQQVETRVLYREWYKYTHGGNEANFLFGADSAGYDIFTRLAHGARLSLILSVCVAIVNLLLGIVIGAFEGYYGGTFDLVFERIKDILYDVPFVVCMTLFQIYLAQKAGPIVSMFFAFVFFGWIKTSSTVRAQFYRFKGQEYVMAARTLGASDARLIFCHILPNAIGFIITASVLSIPGVIFSEANLTYLGIVNLQTDTMTSIGTMLNNGQLTLAEHPHTVFFPAAFISMLLVCFNGFGNGLRDAFNPQLRGAENK